MKHNRGSIIVIALLILSVIVLLTEQLIRNVYVGSFFITTMVDRQQAQLLAIGGINLAIAQLDHQQKDPNAHDKKTPSTDAKEAKDKQLKEFLLRTLPNLNRWQIFDLHEAMDGIEGQIKVCISAEDGKININEIFDFKKQELKPAYDGVFKRLTMDNLKEGELHTKFLEYFKKRQRKLDDITELFSLGIFNQESLFYHPTELPGKKEKSTPNPNIALQDMFTTWTTDDKVNPLWFSDALCALFSLERPRADDALHKQEEYKQIVDQIKPEMAQDWETHWKIIEPIYGSKPKDDIMSSLKNIFSKEFEPKVYSVLSYGKVGQAEQTLLAVIKRVKADEESENNNQDSVAQKEETKSTKKPQTHFKVLRLYWL